MPRTMRSLIIGLLYALFAAGLVAPPAHAHGAESETYTADAPVAAGTQCRTSTEGVSKETHPFLLPYSGQLSVTMSGFTGDWDLYVVDDRSGAVVRQSASSANPETLVAALKANQAVSIVACNFAGGPTATVSFTFVPAALVHIGDVSVHEGNKGIRTAVFTVGLDRPTESPVTMSYATSDGTASAPDDYTASEGTATIAAGSAYTTVEVVVNPDRVDEDVETFTLRLSQPSGAVFTDSAGVGTIIDDEPSTGFGVSVGDVRVYEGDVGARAAVFTVSLSKPSTSTVTVSFVAKSNGSTTASDLKNKSGTLTFAPGITSQNIKVKILPDEVAELTETFFVKLTGANGATIIRAVGSGTIADDD